MERHFGHRRMVFVSRVAGPIVGRSGGAGCGKDLSCGYNKTYTRSLEWFIGLISESGKVKLIMIPPDTAAQLW